MTENTSENVHAPDGDLEERQLRLALFYKATYYDRRAEDGPEGLHQYVTNCVHNGTPIVTDDTWATRANVATELRKAAESAQERTAERDKFTALAEQYEAVTEA